MTDSTSPEASSGWRHLTPGLEARPLRTIPLCILPPAQSQQSHSGRRCNWREARGKRRSRTITATRSTLRPAQSAEVCPSFDWGCQVQSTMDADCEVVWSQTGKGGFCWGGQTGGEKEKKGRKQPANCIFGGLERPCSFCARFFRCPFCCEGPHPSSVLCSAWVCKGTQVAGYES